MNPTAPLIRQYKQFSLIPRLSPVLRREPGNETVYTNHFVITTIFLVVANKQINSINKTTLNCHSNSFVFYIRESIGTSITTIVVFGVYIVGMVVVMIVVVLLVVVLVVD